MVDEKTPYHLLIVTLLDHQTAAMLPVPGRCAAKCVKFMCNTLHPETLQAVVGAERCAFGMAFVQASFDDMGPIRPTSGAGGQKTINERTALGRGLNAAGLPAAIEPDLLWLRCHVPISIAFESVAVAAERRRTDAS